MTPQDYKQMLISIIVGACVAFFTTFLEGVVDMLQGMENNAIGGIAASGTYLSGRVRAIK